MARLDQKRTVATPINLILGRVQQLEVIFAAFRPPLHKRNLRVEKILTAFRGLLGLPPSAPPRSPDLSTRPLRVGLIPVISRITLARARKFITLD